MTAYLSENDPERWEKVKEHFVEIPEDWEGEYPVFCRKCGKRAVQTIQMLWILI